MAAYARSLADKRGRNVPLAEQAVTESRAFTEKEAQRRRAAARRPGGAPTSTTCLAQLDGREIARFDGTTAWS